jgi:hypothetical protein
LVAAAISRQLAGKHARKSSHAEMSSVLKTLEGVSLIICILLPDSQRKNNIKIM